MTTPKPECITQETILNTTWSNCPQDVINEVSDELWPTEELGNDTEYYTWSNTDTERGLYPIIAKYLDSRGYTDIKIHYWW